MNTKFAPAERSPYEIVFDNYNELRKQPYIDEVLNTLPYIALVLNLQRQIVYGNTVLLEQLGLKGFDDLLGKRPGELFNCVHSCTEEGGCGTSEACRFCGAVNTILRCIKEDKKVSSEARLTIKVEDGVQSLDLMITGTPMEILGEKHIIVSINDISNEKRRLVLERMFFHDIMNTTSNIKGYAELINRESEPPKLKRFGNIIGTLSEDLMEEIMSQRDIFLAESHLLKVEKRHVFVDEVFMQVIIYMQGYISKINKQITLVPINSGIEMEIDHLLLKRVLINLVKNAIEASVPDSKVSLGSRLVDGIIEIFVHNSSYIPKDVQMQIFQRSFSTKCVNRGIGTYSVKLITEEFLKGKVFFTSSEEVGTTFFLRFPEVMVSAAV